MTRRAWPYVQALLTVAATCVVAEVLYRLLATTNLSMVFLAGVLISAVRLGALPGLLAAVSAFVVYDFYLAEPRFSLQLQRPEDVLVLLTFLAVALLTGGLAGRVRDEGQRAKARADTTDTLYQASRTLSAAWDEERLREGLAAAVASAAKGEAHLFDGGSTWSAPAGSSPPPPLQTGLGVPARGSPWRRRALVAGDVTLGSAAWRRTDPTPASADEEQLINVLVDLGAAAVARARLGVANSRMEALARTEELRNALLSSISHDFRTPLAAILASASSLKDLGEEMPPTVRTDLLLTIEEEAQRLNRFVANLLNMTRLDAGALSVDRRPVDLAELVERVWSGFGKRVGTRRLETDWPPGPFLALADAALLEHVLANVIDNAVRFSPDGSAVSVSGMAEQAGVRLLVLDEGSGVAAADRQRIFEKFYRTAAASQTAGTGLGLSIARGLIEALDGTIEAGRHPDGRKGLAITLRLPAAGR